MPGFNPTLVNAVEQLAIRHAGQVEDLIRNARSLSADFTSDLQLAAALEAAAVRRAQANDRQTGWVLACAVAMVRGAGLTSVQEDAELTMARSFGELAHTTAAHSPLPEGARWLVAGQPQPPPTPATVELSRRNALAYIEQLDAELASREGILFDRLTAASTPRRSSGPAWDPSLVDAVREVLGTYSLAILRTRSGLGRVIDGVVARARDPEVARAGTAALREVDDGAGPALERRLQRLSAQVEANPGTAHPTLAERSSLVGSAPPAFQYRPSSPNQVAEPVDHLEQRMRAAFEAAWSTPSPANRERFEQAVRARYERETASIADPNVRRAALDHYVAQALAQLPPSKPGEVGRR